MKNLIRLISVFIIIPSLSYAQVAYTQLYNNSTFNQRDITLKPVGATAGKADVSGTGAATYSIPVWCPPGTNGMQPGIALVYNSQGGNGIMGMGWSLSGLSAITRVVKDLYHDGEVTPVSYTMSDKYALDGVRLVYKSGTYGAANAEYAPEAEDFSHIVSYGAKGNGPESFFVTKKDGTLLQYGNTPDSRFLTNDGNHVMMWCVNKIVDISGNYIEFTYSFSDRVPRIQEIKYTGNIYTNLNPYNKITFEYAERTDKNKVYEGGSYISASLLLTKVKAYDENNTVQKTYELSYGNDGINSYLKEVTEKNKNGDGLNSMQFKYGSSSNSIMSNTITGLPGPAPNVPLIPETTSGDFDGDGTSEILILNRDNSPQFGIYNSGFSVYKKNSTNGFGLPITVNFPAPRYIQEKRGVPGYRGDDNTLNKADFNGDGLEDIFTTHISNSSNNTKHVISGVSIYWGNKNSVVNTNNPSSFSPSLIWNGQSMASCDLATQHTSSVMGDFDGNGKTDFFLLCEDGGSSVSHFPFIYDEGTIAISVIGIDFSEINTHTFEMRLLDFDGDGKNEIIFLTQNYFYVYTFIKNANGTYVATKLKSGGFPNLWHKIWTGDFNGDGKTDFLTNVSGNLWEWAISTGKDFISVILPITDTYEDECSFECGSFPNKSKGTDRGDDIIVADYNGDGKSDIMFSNAYCPCSGSSHTVNTIIDLYLTKNNTVEKVSGYSNSSEVVNPQTITTADIYGTGKQQLMFRFANASNVINLNVKGTPYPLTDVADGFGNKTSFNYESISTSTNYTKGNNSQYPLIDVQAPLYVVTRIDQPNGLGAINSVYYKYAEAVSHLTGRGFIGFKKLVLETPLANSKAEVISDIKGVLFVPYVKETNTYNMANNQINQVSHITNNIDFTQGTTYGTFYPQLLSQTENNLLTGATTITTNTYDNNNFGTIVSSTRNINNVEIITTNTTYIQPGSTTVPCMPELVTLTRQRTGQSAATDKTFFTYDWAGRVYQKNKRHLTTYNIFSTYQYDYFGNLTEESIYNGLQAGGNPNTLSNSYAYDTKGRFKTSATNSLGQTSYATWDAVWGKPLTITGIDGIITTNTYNIWGKLTSTKLKTGTSEEETLTYSDGWGSGGNTFYILASHPDKPDVKTWYDKLGREVKTQAEHPSGQWAESAKTYDSKGNLLSETALKLSSEPSFITAYANNDSYNRLTSVTDNFGTTSYAYSFLGNGEVKTTVTRAGQSKSTTVDAAGRTLKEEDHGGELRYTYDSRGNLLTVSHRQNLLMLHTYNSVGIKTNTYDVSAGTTTYSYDAFGRLKSEKDANSHTHSFLYNELGLLTQRTGPEGTISYTYYGAGSGLANQLASVNVSGVTGSGIKNGLDESYDYDGFGRLVRKEKYIDGDIFTTEYDYDKNGSVTHKEYGNGYYLDYTYSNGYLTNVVQPFPQFPPLNAPYLFKGGQINGRGQYTTYALLNNVTTTNAYYHGYLTRTTAPGIQDLEMSYNYATGNLQFRKDYKKHLKEDFTYDNLNRLTQSVVSNYVTSASEPAYNTTYDLNGFGQSRGNITSKTDIGSFATGFTKGTTSSSKNEEAVISDQTQDITYTSFRKTRSVKETDPATGIEYEQIFTYDAHYNRVKAELYENGSLTAIRLYLDGYEVNIDPATYSKQYIHYIAGGDGLCAIAEVQDQYYRNIDNATYHVVYEDHLGSIVTATDVNGNIEVEQNFDAWGRARNPQTWNYNNVNGVGLTNAWLYRGYTGHEHMPHFSIINMNGRMYDPALGRMMSPDPYIMGGTQGYNRYSYCLNNPLKYTDPSGEFVKATMFLMGFSCEFIRNITSGTPDALGTAYNTTSYRLDQFGSAWQYKIYSDDKNVITAGFDPFNVGLSANYYRKEGNWTFSASLGYGVISEGYASVGAAYNAGDWTVGMGGSYSTKYDNYNIGGGISYNDGRFNASYYYTYYGGNSDPALNQWNGGFTIGYGDFKIREENDFLAWGLSSDKGRTQALEISYGNFAVGSYVHTNDGKGDSGGPTGFDNRPSPILGTNKHGFGAWLKGYVYKAPLYYGYNSGNNTSRIGFSAWWVQDATQNWMHQNDIFRAGNQNYYVDYSKMYQGGYFYSGYYNSFSLYGF